LPDQMPTTSPCDHRGLLRPKNIHQPSRTIRTKISFHNPAPAFDSLYNNPTQRA